VTKQGADKVAEYSVLVKNANDYYAVIEAAGGKFRRRPIRQDPRGKSPIGRERVARNGDHGTDMGLLVQDDKGRIRLLRATDLVDQTKE
jgi:hypothetical protein